MGAKAPFIAVPAGRVASHGRRGGAEWGGGGGVGRGKMRAADELRARTLAIPP